jgi:hypothetical protein
MTLHNKKGDSLDVTIRLAKPSEAPRLVELLIKQNGYNYPNPNLYDEGFMRRSLENKTLYFFVAELADGTIAGMVGANVENIGALFILLVVDTALRGFGIGKILQRSLLDAGLWDAYPCIYVYCSTLHTLSQSIEFGYRPSGLILNQYIYDTGAENLVGLSLPLKSSYLLMCLPKAKRDVGVLCPPPSHAAFIEDIYRSLGVAYTVNGGEGIIAGQSQCGFEQKDAHCYGELFVSAVGNDFADILSDILNRYGALEKQSFNVFINLNDPGCPAACAILEKNGFFFTGVQALSAAHEYLIMHYSPSIPVSFDKIAVVPDFQKQFMIIQNLYREAKRG